MINVKRMVAVVGVSLGAAALAPSAALAGDFECRGDVGAVTVVGNLIVPDDTTCNLSGTRVEGSLVAKSRSILNASGVNVTGGLQGEAPAKVSVASSSFGNGVSVRKSEDVNHAVATGGVIDFTGNTITGDLALEDNREPINLDSNEIVGSIQASKNVGGVDISLNQIGNGLQCQDNTPAQTGGGNVAKQKQGQSLYL